MKIEFSDINIHVDIPALEKIADVLAGMRIIPNVSISRDIADIAMNTPETSNVTPIFDKDDEVVELEEKPVESKKTANSGNDDNSQKTNATDAKKYTVEKIAVAAMALRDENADNYTKILAMFPEFGIESLGDLRGNDDAITAFAERLRGMGADI